MASQCQYHPDRERRIASELLDKRHDLRYSNDNLRAFQKHDAASWRRHRDWNGRRVRSWLVSPEFPETRGSCSNLLRAAWNSGKQDYCRVKQSELLLD